MTTSRLDVPQPRRTCPLCGSANECAPAAAGSFEVECWCTRVSIDPQVLAEVPPALRGIACLCRACAVRRRAGSDG